MKKNYIKPTMRVVQLKQQHIICASPVGRSVHNVSNSDDINWKNGGFDDNEGDY